VTGTIGGVTGTLPGTPPPVGGVTGTPPPGGTVGGTTGTVGGTVGGAPGGVITDTGSTIAGAIDGVLGSTPGSGGSTLPSSTVADLVDKLLGGSSSGASSGGGSSPAGSSQGAGFNSSSSSSDKAAPKLRFTILSKLGRAAKTGKLKLRVTANEPAVVAFDGLLRPGQARRVHGKALPVSRKLIRTKTAVLAFRSAGKLTVTVKLPKRGRATLANARTARLSLQVWASDVARNQMRKNVKRTLKR
jgi:hypothetical protein